MSMKRTCRISRRRLSSDSGTGFFYLKRSGGAMLLCGDGFDEPRAAAEDNKDGVISSGPHAIEGPALPVRVMPARALRRPRRHELFCYDNFHESSQWGLSEIDGQPKG